MSRFQCSIFFENVNMGQLKMILATIKDGQISLHCHFNKFMKRPGTSFQSSALSQNILEMFVIQHTSI